MNTSKTGRFQARQTQVPNTERLSIEPIVVSFKGVKNSRKAHLKTIARAYYQGAIPNVILKMIKETPKLRPTAFARWLDQTRIVQHNQVTHKPLDSAIAAEHVKQPQKTRSAFRLGHNRLQITQKGMKSLVTLFNQDELSSILAEFCPDTTNDEITTTERVSQQLWTWSSGKIITQRQLARQIFLELVDQAYEASLLRDTKSVINLNNSQTRNTLPEFEKINERYEKVKGRELSIYQTRLLNPANLSEPWMGKNMMLTIFVAQKRFTIIVKHECGDHYLIIKNDENKEILDYSSSNLGSSEATDEEEVQQFIKLLCHPGGLQISDPDHLGQYNGLSIAVTEVLLQIFRVFGDRKSSADCEMTLQKIANDSQPPVASGDRGNYIACCEELKLIYLRADSNHLLSSTDPVYLQLKELIISFLFSEFNPSTLRTIVSTYENIVEIHIEKLAKTIDAAFSDPRIKLKIQRINSDPFRREAVITSFFLLINYLRRDTKNNLIYYSYYYLQMIGYQENRASYDRECKNFQVQNPDKISFMDFLLERILPQLIQSEVLDLYKAYVYQEMTHEEFWERTKELDEMWYDIPIPINKKPQLK